MLDEGVVAGAKNTRCIVNAVIETGHIEHDKLVLDRTLGDYDPEVPGDTFEAKRITDRGHAGLCADKVIDLLKFSKFVDYEGNFF